MEDDPDTVLDLSNTFGDVDNAMITITNVSNANTALLTATKHKHPDPRLYQ